MHTSPKVLVTTGIALPILALAVIVWPLTRHHVHQPVYKGLELAQWLDIVTRHRINGYAPATIAGIHPDAKDAKPEQVHEAEAAVRAIGTNALPCLLVWINPKPNPVKRFYRGILNCIPMPEHTRGFLWAIPGTKDDTLAQFALEGFRLLNTNALPALADLSRLASDTDNPGGPANKALASIVNTLPH